MTDTKDRKGCFVTFADEGDARQAVLGLQGLFWALNMLVVHHVADGVAHKGDIEDGVEKLIVAAMTLADEVAGRF
jgi:hypothetical protein